LKSKESIEIEFAKAINEAQELENIASALTAVANSLITREIITLEKAWKGSNAMALSMKNRTLSADIFETAQNLYSVSKSIKTTAELVYKAEKSALMMAMSQGFR